MLLQDEQYIIKWLSQYGTLTKTQVIRLLKDKPVSTAEKIIRNLKRDMRITDVGGYYLALDEMCKPDQRLIIAVWVLLQFIDQVEPLAHYPAVYPAQIFFLKENVGYEIVVLYDGEQHLMRLLQPQDPSKKVTGTAESFFSNPRITIFCFPTVSYTLFIPEYRKESHRPTGFPHHSGRGGTAGKQPDLPPPPRQP